MILEKEIEEFLSYLKDIRGYSGASVKTYAIALRQMSRVSHFFTEDAVEVLDITPFRMQIKDQNKKTISKKLSAVRSFVKFLNTQKAMEIKLYADSKIKVAQTLPKPVEKKYIDEAIVQSDAMTALIIELIYALGLRISELENLKLEDIERQWVRVRGKGDKIRNIPLLESVAQKVAHYRQKYAPNRYLFEIDGVKLSQNTIRYRLEKSFKKIGIKVTPHQLRHSFATDLLENGARIKDVSELLGHESLSSTQIYTKLSRGKKMQTYMDAHPLCSGDSDV
ncbi:MAG: tyrosine-type recombinase/integrase [Campylobacterota bacterium]